MHNDAIVSKCKDPRLTNWLVGLFARKDYG